MAYNWTEQRLNTLRTMRKNSASTVTIARALGDISAKTIGRKLKELGLDGNYKWPDEKIKILRAGYAKKQSPSKIAKSLGTGYTTKSVATKASELGIASQTDWTKADEELFEYIYSTGLPQKDLLHHLSNYPGSQVRYRIGLQREKLSTLNFDQRASLREQSKKKVAQIIGDHQDDYGERIAAWIAVVTMDTGRDLREFAQVALLPIPYVERIFSRFDLEGIWSVTDRKQPEMSADYYRVIAAICNEEIKILRGRERFWKMMVQ